MKRTRRILRLCRRRVQRRLADDRGATMLEWALLLAAIALPSYFLIALMLNVLGGHYQLISTINGLPFP